MISLFTFIFYNLASSAQQVNSEITDINSLQCTFCKVIINYLYIEVGNNRTPAAIQVALQKVCAVVPGPFRDNCTHFIQRYGPILAILLARNATAVQVCDFIKFCNNGTQTIEQSNSIEIF